MDDATYGPRTEAWQKLSHLAREGVAPIAQLFAEDEKRFERFSVEAGGLLLDFSRQQIDRPVLAALLELAEQVDLAGWIRKMYSGARINNTEDRATLHIALRRPADQPLLLDGEDVMPLVEREREKVRSLARQLHAGELRGATGRRITDIVNIGIGGSDLGIVMAVQALAEDVAGEVQVHCVSNIDGVALTHVLASVDPERTLFVVCSKTFTTLETLTNANAARSWLVEHLGDVSIPAHFVAVSTNHKAMDAFGIAPDRRFSTWDWVGGRYSMWSAIGLTIALAIGADNFDRLLIGAHEMDAHFEVAPFEENLPVHLGLIGVWNRNFLGMASHVVLPYDDHLARFPAYLQQLEMESNGKSVRRNGESVECATCPAVWGEPGSNAQHSFMQLLHQGTDRVSVDFILPAESRVLLGQQHTLSVENCLAQAWALAVGSKSGGRHDDMPGNRPSSAILFRQLSSSLLGALVALYEHKVFVQGVVWDVNSFDQWGVQLGKQLARILASPDLSSSGSYEVIRGVLAHIHRLKATS